VREKAVFWSSVKQLMFILTSFHRHRNVAKGTILQHDVYITYSNYTIVHVSYHRILATLIRC